MSADEATTYYNIGPNGNLVINAATSGPTNNPTRYAEFKPQPPSLPHTLTPPTRPQGFVAYTFNSGPKAVEFGSHRYLQSRQDNLKLIKCSIQDSPDADGTCDLVCTAKAQGGTTGSSVLTGNNDQWYMGNGGNQAVTVKVVF